MLLSHQELMLLIAEGVINADPSQVNATSIDITLVSKIIVERRPLRSDGRISLRDREQFAYEEITINEKLGYSIDPGEFILSQSFEVFNLPDYLSAEYKLKSSMARMGLNHLNAGWCDAGWNGSVLTLELVNNLQHHSIVIKRGDRIGQMVFFKHATVPKCASYGSVGTYNNNRSVMPAIPRVSVSNVSPIDCKTEW